MRISNTRLEFRLTIDDCFRLVAEIKLSGKTADV